MRRLLAVLWVSALAVAAVSCSRGNGSNAGAGQSELVPKAGQAVVTGMADRLVADPAETSPLMPPFTISARERGAANLTIENATVAGRSVTINWNSGTPLPIGGSGGLDLGPTRVEVDGGGVTWALDGAPRAFLPGNYQAAAPVAVGPSGIATPRDSVEFQADDRTVAVARGGTIVHLPPRQLSIDGPGKVTITGQLKVNTPDAKRTAGSVELPDGPFRVTVVPVGHQFRVEAVLQGPVTSS